MLDRDLPFQSTVSLMGSRLGSINPETSRKGGVSRLELSYCIRCLQTLIEQIEHAQKLLQKSNSIYTGWAVFESYTDVRAELGQYLLKKKDKVEKFYTVASGGYGIGSLTNSRLYFKFNQNLCIRTKH